jgi:polyhydroxybutyrate depolymerase
VLEDWPRREALYFIPTSEHAIALAIELHGSGLDPLRQYQMSRLADRLTASGIAVLLPQAATPFQLMPEVGYGFAWNIPGVPLPSSTELSNADDIGYITQLVESFQQKLQLCDAPLFLSGYSGGARLASYMLASGHLKWTAAGLVAGLRPIEHGQRPPPPTISFHGVADTINPFEGGLGPRWDIGVEEAGDRFALAQGCTPDPQEFQLPGADVHIYRLPDGAAALSMYTVVGAAHAWPGTRDEDHLKIFGPAGDNLNASSLIEKFFVSRMTPTMQRNVEPGMHGSPR